jgi:type II secretory ATPase GspE/PulE/Tfp pilus assembly ATPase PilB-like protein
MASGTWDKLLTKFVLDPLNVERAPKKAKTTATAKTDQRSNAKPDGKPVTAKNGQAQPAGTRQPPPNAQRPAQAPGPQQNRPPIAGGATALPARVRPKPTATQNLDGKNNQAPPFFMRTQDMPVDEETIRRLKAFDGKVLSAPEVNNGLDLTQAEMERCVLLDNGELIKDKNDPNDKHIWAAVGKMYSRSYTFTKVWLADPSLIRMIYENQARRSPITQSGPLTYARGGLVNEMSGQQTKFFEIVKMADELKANDIRILIGEKEAKLWLRISGALRYIREYKKDEMLACFASVYALLEGSEGSAFNAQAITQAVIPGDVFKQISQRVQGLRLMFIPVSKGRCFMSARMITEDTAEDIDIDALGYPPFLLRQFQKMRAMPWGVFPITGPTGSGKSTTLKVTLEALAKETRGEASILTAEDPSEYEMGEGIVQFTMKGTNDLKKRLEGYTNMLIALLRADPDIICIGEIREEQSAGIAIKSASSGHGTWTTLHTNNAISVFPRLRGMDVPDYSIFDPSLIPATIAQRLIRTVCPHCALTFQEATPKLSASQRTKYQEIFKDYPDLLNAIRFRNERGCSEEDQKAQKRRCVRGSGGRTLAAEVLMTDEQLMLLARENRTQEAIAYAKQHLSFFDMAEHGFYKAFRGQCDPGDVEAAIGTFERIDIKRLPKIVELCSDDGRSLEELLRDGRPDHARSEERI